MSERVELEVGGLAVVHVVGAGPPMLYFEGGRPGRRSSIPDAELFADR